VRVHRIITAREAHIGREIFAEVGHPAVDTDVEQLAAEHSVGEPLAALCTGEIDHAGVELAEVDRKGLVGVRSESEVTRSHGLPVQGPVHRKVRVGVGHEADAPGLELGNAAGQVGVARGVPPPVPEQPAPEAGLADAGPILAPQRAHRRARSKYGLQPFEAAQPFLEADDRAADRPIGQGGLPAEASR